MPLVVTVELPTADVVVVVPADDEGRVMILIDPRVPFTIGAEVVACVARLRRPGGRLEQLSTVLAGPVYTLGAYAVG